MLTQLVDRQLFFDGQSAYDPKDIYRLYKKQPIKYVTHTTKDIEQFNLYSNIEDQIEVKNICDSLPDKQWTIPANYQQLNVAEYVFDQHVLLTAGMSDQEIELRDRRLVEELQLFKRCQYFDIIRLMVYIVDQLNQTNTVYGVGRGSATSSYLLYVIGVHDIDSYLYDLDIHDFIKITE